MKFKAYILFIDDDKSIEYSNDCLESCKQHNINVEKFQGFKGLSIQEVDNYLGLKYNPEVKKIEWTSEYNCDLGHISIWRKIAESNIPGIVFEHDAIIKHNFDDLEVKDEQIVFLGPRVENRSDYEYPEGETLTYHQVTKFEGAHAYAITPNTARYLLERVLETKETIFRSIDGHLGIRNTFNLKMLACDPALAVSEVGNRHSYVDVSNKTPLYNREYFPKFLKGVKDESKLLEVNNYKFTEDWFSRNPPVWIDIFKKQNIDYENNIVNVLEIGAFEGRSTCWISDNLLNHDMSRLVCIDTFEGSEEHTKDQKNDLQKRFFKNIMLSKHPEKTHVIIGSSKDILPKLIMKNILFDIIYVDGDHSPDGVLNDGILSFILLKKGGVLIFDDYEWVYNGQPVKAGITKFEQLFGLQPIHSGWQRMYTKEY